MNYTHNFLGAIFICLIILVSSCVSSNGNSESSEEFDFDLDGIAVQLPLTPINDSTPTLDIILNEDNKLSVNGKNIRHKKMECMVADFIATHGNMDDIKSENKAEIRLWGKLGHSRNTFKSIRDHIQSVLDELTDKMARTKFNKGINSCSPKEKDEIYDNIPIEFSYGRQF